MPKVKTKRTLAPFEQRVGLFDNIDQQRLAAGLKSTERMHDPYVRKWKGAVVKALTRWGRYGTYDVETSECYVHPAYRSPAASMLSSEAVGAITPDKTADFFRTVSELRDSKEYVPDTSYLDFMVSTKMQQQLEKREEWDADMQFVMMKEAGQVKYGKLDRAEAQMTTAEWGSGISISWTWFETNMYKIKMARLAPKFKFAAFDQQADNVYAGLVSAGTRTLATFGLTATNMVIHDINLAWQAALMRWKNSFGKTPFANMNPHIVAPPEAWWFLDRAFRANQQTVMAQENFYRRPSVTFTTKLNTDGLSPNTIYILPSKWEQNEFGTRIPLEAHGPEDDIDNFSTKISWRMDYGSSFDPYSIVKLTFDPTLASWSIYGPLETTN